MINYFLFIFFDLPSPLINGHIFIDKILSFYKLNDLYLGKLHGKLENDNGNHPKNCNC